jgi:type III protein arginine methyltransferase
MLAEKMNKIGRNDPCPCGSGKKYKSCCQSAEYRRTEVSTAQSRASSNSTGSPDISMAFFNQALAMHGQGRFDEAVENYRGGLAVNPNIPEMFSNLGNALDSLGRLDDAIEAYEKALSIKPDMPEVHNNLALALEAQGKHEAALQCYRAALSLRPDFAPAYFNLGRLQQLRGEHKAATDSYRHLLTIQPDNAQASSNLGSAFEELGDLEASVLAYRRAIEISPNLVAAQNGLARVLTRLVPSWHVPMMNDQGRNEAYYAALRSAVRPESRVFEIGTGSGLLSMMAASLGAADVTTCEAEPLIADAAKRIIAQNGLSQKIKQISKKSTEIELGADLSQPADILVSEIFSSEVLGERVLSSIEDTKRRLLRPNCRVIPAKASIMIALFGGDDIGSNLLVGDVCGFDLKGFNSIVSRRQTIARNDLPIEMMSEDIEAFTFDFQNDSIWPEESKVLRIPIKSAGRCLGIIQWMHLQMDENTEFENHPTVFAPASSWTRCAYILPEPVDVRPGHVAIVNASHNRVYPWFTVARFE